jgi:DNA-binding NtrC family response regulator
MCRGKEIELEDIVSHGIGLGVPALTWAGGKYRRLADVEKAYIRAVLEDMKGNKGRAALALGIDRKTLWAKLKKYGLKGGTDHDQDTN